MEWPNVILILGVLTLATILVVSVIAVLAERRKTQLSAAQEDSLRQLLHRYEQLAANTLDAQQRAAADVAELRARTASVEQLLRTVE